MSAGEIAELTGKTRQAVDKYAKKNNWPFEEDTGQAKVYPNALTILVMLNHKCLPIAKSIDITPPL